jgi:hypothetical protein
MELQGTYGCDIYLGPVFPVVSPSKDSNLLDLLYGYSASLYWSVLDMPAGVVPQSQVNIDETSYKNEVKDNFEHHAGKAMKDSAGMPIGV